MVVDKYKGYIWRIGRTLAKGSLADVALKLEYKNVGPIGARAV